MFNYRQVKSDISDNFSHAWELMCLMTETFICLLAQDLQGFTSSDERPDSAPSDIEGASAEEKSSFFEYTCKKIVNCIWHNLDVDKLKQDDGSGLPIFCCGEDTDEDVIGCENRSNCPNGEFFHYSCAGVDPNNITTPWYCSDRCRHLVNPSYKYCICKTDLGGDTPMIGCSAEGQCTRVEWYHMQCIGIDSTKKQPSKWFCCDECIAVCKGKGKNQKERKPKVQLHQ